MGSIAWLPWLISLLVFGVQGGVEIRVCKEMFRIKKYVDFSSNDFAVPDLQDNRKY